MTAVTTSAAEGPIGTLEWSNNNIGAGTISVLDFCRNQMSTGISWGTRFGPADRISLACRKFLAESLRNFFVLAPAFLLRCLEGLRVFH
jgi:hypothetical protein